MTQARCADWIVLLSYMIGKVEGPSEVFKTDPNRYEEFSKVIVETNRYAAILSLFLLEFLELNPSMCLDCSQGYLEFSKKVAASLSQK